MASFGSPGGGSRGGFSKPSPPERGSFPLDHDGDCKYLIDGYLRCLRQHRGVNDDECRMMSKAYLKCRMDRNLMAPDEMKNLGFEEQTQTAGTGGQSSEAQIRSAQDTAK